MSARIVPLAIAAWALLVGAGMTALVRYKGVPGTAGEIVRRWPEASTLARSQGTATLVMAVHPRCVCTRASLDQLAVLLARTRAAVEPILLFHRPEGADASWTQSETWAQASRLPGARLIEDPGGIEASRFGAETSGHAFVFDPDGTLLFEGGLTGARGHEGDNAGLSRALGVLEGGSVARAESAVFGCEIFDRIETGGR